MKKNTAEEIKKIILALNNMGALPDNDYTSINDLVDELTEEDENDN
jgi:hypothetical protein